MSNDDATVDVGVLGHLPKLSAFQVELANRLSSCDPEQLFASWTELAPDPVPVKVRAHEISQRASGLRRAGVIVTLSWPEKGTRIGLGIETELAHTLVDTLLGYSRLESDHRRPVTPIEWGILTALISKIVTDLQLPPSSLLIDRVGPDPFDPTDLGSLITIRWPVEIQNRAGSLRLWVPVSLAREFLARPSKPISETNTDQWMVRFGDLTTQWRAEAGTSTFPRGLSRLRVGGVAPIDGSPLGGTPSSPTGQVRLTLTDRDGRSTILAEPAPRSGGARLIILESVRREVQPRESLAVNPSNSEPQSITPADVPVTLVVELGRLNIPLRRLADLKPGDVVELGRHAREPVELTSNGRLVARGELVQIDTELGVRITNVLL